MTPVSNEIRVAEAGVGNDPNAKKRLASLDQNALAEQILAASDTSKWKGEGWGSAYANAQEMAKLLDSVGIKNLNQFGRLPDGTYGNKETGQVIDSGSGRWQRQGGADLFGGTGAGAGNTAYRVRFDDNGSPQFYTTKGSSNDLAMLMEDLGPLAQIGLAIATGGLSIPQQIAVNMAVQVAAGKDIGEASTKDNKSYYRTSSEYNSKR
jgi:hypothetical protein